MNFRDIKSALLVGVCAAAGAFGLADGLSTEFRALTKDFREHVVAPF